MLRPVQPRGRGRLSFAQGQVSFIPTLETGEMDLQGQKSGEGYLPRVNQPGTVGLLQGRALTSSPNCSLVLLGAHVLKLHSVLH